jgi:eukaryotic-like serine/threonine-protein kinase
MQPPSQVKLFIREQYAIVDLLGKGASGAVYLVKDERHPHTRFVLKEMMHAVRKERRGFPFDAAVLKRLKHLAPPHIYQVFPDDKHDRFYLLMDYIQGSNLAVVQRSVPGQRFSLPEAMALMSPIIDAVGYLHRQRPILIHGDIKPSNIIVPRAGASSVLVDFGGGKDLEADTPAHQRMLHYRAPEQSSRGERVLARICMPLGPPSTRS